jgi:hypothetical protein
MTPEEAARLLLDNLVMWLAVFAGLYVYFALTLHLLAHRTGTPGGWKAWVPILNLGLMARTGRRSLLWAFLCVVPLLGFIAIAYIWAGIATARNKPAILGVLILIPGVNLLLPLMLLPGSARSAPAAASTLPRPLASVAPGPMRCPACSAEYSADDLYCADCGNTLSADQMRSEPEPSTAAIAAAPSGRAGIWSAVALVVVLVAVGAYFAMPRFRSSPGTDAVSASAALPPRLAGVLREFPVDNTATPARPTTVVSENLADSAPSSARVPPGWLPPGVESRTLAKGATAMTSARYQVEETGPAVNVHVLETPVGGPETTRQVMERIEQTDASATRSQVQLSSPSGTQYDGWKLAGPNGQSYVLGRQDAPLVVIVYAPTANAYSLADRLAANVGNGNGLLDYPETSRAIGLLPASLPPGFALDEIATYRSADLVTPETQGGVLTDLGLGASGVMDVVRQALPETMTMGRYRDGADRRWNLLVGDYGGVVRVNAVWTIIRAALAASGVRVDDAGDGLVLNASDGTFVLRKEGNRIRVVRGDPRAPTGPLLALAGAAAASSPTAGATASTSSAPPTALTVPMPGTANESSPPEREPAQPATATTEQRGSGLSLLGVPGESPGVARGAGANARSVDRGFEGNWTGTEVMSQGLAGEKPGSTVTLGLLLLRGPDGRWQIREQTEYHVWLFLQWYTPVVTVTGNEMDIGVFHEYRGEDIKLSSNEDRIELVLSGDDIVGTRTSHVRNMGPTARRDQLGVRRHDIRLRRVRAE